MVSNEAEDDGEVKTVEVWKGAVRDQREIKVRETGLVVTHRINTTTTSPVEFQVVDPLPGEFDIDEIGFHPDHEPPHGRVDGDQAVLSGVIQPGEELVVTYGIRLSSASGEAPVSLSVGAPPSVELSRPLEPEAVDEADLEAAAMPRSAGTAEPTDHSSRAFFDWLRRSLKAGEGPGEGALAEETTEESKPTEPDGTTADEEASSAAAQGQAADQGMADPDRTETDTDGPSAPASPTERVGDEFDFAETDAGSESADVPGEVESDRHGGEPVAETLLHQLESGALSADQRRRLASALLDPLELDEAPRYTTDVRLRKLESSLQEFEAYTEALGAIIDEHGPAEEFLGEVRSEIHSLGAAVDDLRTALNRAAETRESHGEQLDALADEVAVLTSRLERLDGRVESLRADHRTQTSSIEGRIDSLAPAAERVEELSTDIESLRADVDEVRTRHRAIAQALMDDPDQE